MMVHSLNTIKFWQLLVCVNVFFFSAFASKRIVNGVNAGEDEFKFVVSLQRNGTHFCGGTILDENYILTAAHCVCNVNWDVLDLLTVKLTPLELNDPNAVTVPVQEVICNDYDVLELIKDVAILNLLGRIPTSFIQPVKLPENNFSTTLPLHGVLVGWGFTSTGGSISNVLQKVDVVVYNDDMCAQSYFGTRNIEHQICSGWPENNRGSCQGDSGGPLLVGSVQIGVISFGDDTDCAVSDMARPKISARVSAYLEWINGVISSSDVSTEEQTTTQETTTNKEVETTTVEVDVENTDDDESGSDLNKNLTTTTETIRGNYSSLDKSIFAMYFYFVNAILVLSLQYFA